jgi:hypothetical protein
LLGQQKPRPKKGKKCEKAKEAKEPTKYCKYKGMRMRTTNQRGWKWKGIGNGESWGNWNGKRREEERGMTADLLTCEL